MRRALAVAAVLAFCLCLTACGEDGPHPMQQRWEQCIGAGGSWIETAWGKSCVMPGYEGEK